MTTIHDEEKIKELRELTQKIESCIYSIARLNDTKSKVAKDNLSWLFNQKLQEYAEHIRQKTIDECIACVPAINSTREVGATLWNACRTQIITNLEQLKK